MVPTLPQAAQQGGDAEEAGGSGDEESEGEGEKAAAPAQRKRLAPAGEGGDDSAALADVMMTRKTRKMYQSLQRSAQAKRQRVEALEKKAAALKQQQGQKGAGQA